MPFLVKAIKPRHLRVSRVRLELLNALRKEGTVQKRMLAGTVKYWKGDVPKFESVISLSGGDAQLLVGPTGNRKGVEKWVWTDEGTPSHTIRPVRAKVLRFKVGGRSGSKPGTLKTRPATEGTQWRSARQVTVSTKARRWSIVVLKERYKPYREAMNNALEKGLEKGGWN